MVSYNSKPVISQHLLNFLQTAENVNLKPIIPRMGNPDDMACNIYKRTFNTKANYIIHIRDGDICPIYHKLDMILPKYCPNKIATQCGIRIMGLGASKIPLPHRRRRINPPNFNNNDNGDKPKNIRTAWFTAVRRLYGKWYHTLWCR